MCEYAALNAALHNIEKKKKKNFLLIQTFPIIAHSGCLPKPRIVQSLKSQVVLLQTAHSWANAGVLLGARMHRERVAFEAIKVSGRMKLVREK